MVGQEKENLNNTRIKHGAVVRSILKEETHFNTGRHLKETTRASPREVHTHDSGVPRKQMLFSSYQPCQESSKLSCQDDAVTWATLTSRPCLLAPKGGGQSREFVSRLSVAPR